MIRNAYSELLYVGDAISARDVRAIRDHAFVAVVDLAANEPSAALPRDVVYWRIPIHDDGSNDDALLAVAIDCVCILLRRKVRTLVACSAGMSRVPTISAAAIALLSGRPLADCLKEIVEESPHDVSPQFYASVDAVLATMRS